MKKILLTTILIFIGLCATNAQGTHLTEPFEKKEQDCITISGTVSDFKGHVIPNADICIRDNHFNELYNVRSDSCGHYSLTIPKGKYPYMTCIRMENYPNSETFNGNKQEAMLEFWGYGVIADIDKTIDIHYDKMEVYGVNVFEVQGGTGNYQIYVRPMSLTRFFQSKGKSPVSQMAPPEDKLKIKVSVDGEEVSVINQQRIVEATTKDGLLYGFVITTTKEKSDSKTNYKTFNITLEDLENGDKGEALYTYLR